MADDLAASSLATLNGSSIAVRTDLGSTTVNASRISAPDISADACIIHGVDSLPVPPSLL